MTRNNNYTNTVNTVLKSEEKMSQLIKQKHVLTVSHDTRMALASVG